MNKDNGKDKTSYGFCKCGCGQITKIAWRTDRSRNWTKGEPIHFILGHSTKGRFGHSNTNWKGGRTLGMGYSQTLLLGHHRSHSNGYVFDHTIIAEKALGKPLPPGSVIHHANGTKSGPLVICQDNVYHLFLHQRMRAFKDCGHSNWLKCSFCKQYDDPINMYVAPNGHGIHRKCGAEYKKRKRRSL